MFQIRFGTKISSAIAPPNQSQRFCSTRRSALNSSPSTSPAPKISIEYLFSRPNPAKRPNHIQSFMFPVLMMRMARYAQPVQNSGSKAFIVSRASIPKIAGATSTDSAARACAKRFPPSSRAISAVSSTSATPASAGNNRMAASD